MDFLEIASAPSDNETNTSLRESHLKEQRVDNDNENGNKSHLEVRLVERALAQRSIDVVQDPAPAAPPHLLSVVAHHREEPVGIRVLAGAQDEVAGKLLVESVLIAHLCGCSQDTQSDPASCNC